MKRAPILHPFFFALFPILALYAHNIRSIPVPLKELARPLFVSLACAIALFVLLRAIIKDPAKAGLIVSLFALWFLSFGHLAGQVAVLTEGIYDRSLFFATALLVGVGGFLIVRSRRTFGGLTRVLNAVAVTLVVFNVFTMAQTLTGRHHVAPAKEVKVSGQGNGHARISITSSSTPTPGPTSSKRCSLMTIPNSWPGSRRGASSLPIAATPITI